VYFGQHLVEYFVALVALGDVVVVVVFTGTATRGELFAALPVVAVDDEDVADVEVVGVEFAFELLLLLDQGFLDGLEFTLGVDYVDGPLQAALLFLDECDFGVEEEAGVDGFE
jgi:hypothetical protein